MKWPYSLSLNNLVTLLLVGVIGTAILIGGLSIFLVWKVYRDYSETFSQTQQTTRFYKLNASLQKMSWDLSAFMETGNQQFKEAFFNEKDRANALVNEFLKVEVLLVKKRKGETEPLGRLLEAFFRIDTIANQVFASSKFDREYISSKHLKLAQVLRDFHRRGYGIEAFHRAEGERTMAAAARKLRVIGGLYTVGGLVGVSLIFIFYRLATRKLLKPVQDLGSASLAIAAGNFATTVETGGVAELGQLQEAFNLMSARLEEYRKRVEDFSESLEEKVRKRTLALEETTHRLQESQYQLSRAERLAVVGEIAAEITHEINNPLSGVKDCVQILEEMRDRPRSPKREKYVALMKQGLKRIEFVMRQLLDFSREPYRRDITQVDLNQALEEVLSLTSHRILRCGVEVIKELEPRLNLIQGNPSALQQLLVNLIFNALDAMEETGGKLSLLTRNLDDGQVEIRVADTGSGIPREDLGKIFSAFFTTKRSKRGTGLGLTIGARIVKEHGGKISVSSEVGKGTVFSILFPS